jgi:poly(A) polymerase
MEKALEIQRQVQEILGTDEVYLVGGSVRDLVMGNDPKDYDFTTSMLPEEMVEKVKAAGRRVYTIGEKFGTIGFKVPVAGETPNSPTPLAKFEYVEVTTFRSEVYTSKSRKPEVKFVPSLDEDLARRDFTFNAMVLRSDGSIYDPYGGRLHIHAKKIQTVGMPKDRIQEDPLRIFRAARFAARYGFNIDPNFIGKARQLADRIFDVSVERWVQELDKLLTSDEVYDGIYALHNMGVLQRILPELYDPSTDDHFYIDVDFSKDPDAAWKQLIECICVPDDIKEQTRTIRFVADGICHRFKFSNDRRDLILDKVKKKD